jgi:hypothetical protein
MKGTERSSIPGIGKIILALVTKWRYTYSRNPTYTEYIMNIYRHLDEALGKSSFHGEPVMTPVLAGTIAATQVIPPIAGAALGYHLGRKWYWGLAGGFVGMGASAILGAVAAAYVISITPPTDGGTH